MLRKGTVKDIVGYNIDIHFLIPFAAVPVCGLPGGLEIPKGGTRGKKRG